MLESSGKDNEGRFPREGPREGNSFQQTTSGPGHSWMTLAAGADVFLAAVVREGYL
jgi:hypothetical protein